MDARRRNDDCYHYYRSGCSRGDKCLFRHEPLALGCRTTCSYWQRGQCMQKRCSFRHEVLKKNRKVISRCCENVGREGDLRARIQARRAHGKFKENAHVQAMSADYIRRKSTHKEGHSNSDIPDSALAVKHFKNSSDARTNSVAQFHTGQKKPRSDYRFKRHSIFRGPKFTVAFNEEGSPNNCVCILTEARRNIRMVRTSAQNRKRNNFRFEARKNMRLDHIQSKSATSYIGTRHTTVASGFNSTGDNDLRAKILEMRENRISKLKSDEVL